MATKATRRGALLAAALATVGALGAACASSSTSTGSSSSAEASSTGSITATVAGQSTDAADTGDGSVIMVGYLPSDPFWQVVKKGADTAAEELGVDFRYVSGTDPKNFVADWTQTLEAAIAQKPDVLLFGDFIPDAWEPLVKEAIANGTQVIAFNSGINYKDWGGLTYIGENPTSMGQVAAQRQIDAGVKSGLCVNNAPTVPNQVLRCEGYQKALEAAGGSAKVLNLDPATADNQTAVQSAILGELRSNPDLNGVFAIWGSGAAPAVAAGDQSGREVVVGNADLTPAGNDLIRNGKLLFTLDQQGFLEGYYSVLAADQYMKYGLMPAEPIYTGPTVVDNSNIEDIAKISAANPGVRGSI